MPGFDLASSSILFEGTASEQRMDDLIGFGPRDPHVASRQARTIATEGNRLCLAQHPDKLKQPNTATANSDGPDQHQYARVVTARGDAVCTVNFRVHVLKYHTNEISEATLEVNVFWD